MPYKILKFCYILIAVFLMGCGDQKKKEIEVNQDTQSPISANTPEDTTKIILCFGDSITAGYGLDDTNDAFPAVLQKKIDSLGLDYTVINSGLSGETTSGGRSRLNWILNQEIDIFILELGANDGLRGISLTETQANLQRIIDELKKQQPDIKIILAGMELPPNMGQDYTRKFRDIYKDLAQQNDLAFIPFILKDVGGVEGLNQNDGIHPTVEGHKIVANTVWETLQPMLKP